MLLDSDEELLAKYQEGSLRAFENFYDRNYKLAYHYLRGRCSSDQQAEDLLQESFLKLHKSIISYDKTKKALPWFFTIIRNTLIDSYRKKKDFFFEDMDIFIGSLEEAKKEEKDEIEELLSNLNPQDREIIINRFFKEMSYKDIAKDSDSSLVAVRKRVSRILAKLRLYLKGPA